MTAPIVVDIASGPAVHGELAALLVEACSRAAGGGGCVLGGPERTGTEVKAHAVVRLDGPDHRHLRVDVAALSHTGGALHSREVDFQDEDPLPDRYRTAGLMVAAMAAERAGDAPPRAGAEAAPPAAEQAAGSGPLGWHLGAGGLAGSGLDGGPARAGGWIMAAVHDPRSGFLGTLSASYAAAVREPAPGLSVQWLTLAGGGGLAAPIEPLGVLVRTRIEAFFDWTITSGSDPPKPPDKPPEAGHGWGAGTRAALDVVWPADARVGLVGSAEAFVRIHGTDLHGAPKPKATLPAGGLTGALGLQLRLQ